MNKLFNTVFETELRIVLLLNEAGNPFSATRINALDSIILSSEEFPFKRHVDGIGDKSELNVRVSLIKQALQQGIVDGYFKVQIKDEGFYYCLSDSGRIFADAFSDDYADAYSSLAYKMCRKLASTSDIEIMKSLIEYKG